MVQRLLRSNCAVSYFVILGRMTLPVEVSNSARVYVGKMRINSDTNIIFFSSLSLSYLLIHYIKK